MAAVREFDEHTLTVALEKLNKAVADPATATGTAIQAIQTAQTLRALLAETQPSTARNVGVLSSELEARLAAAEDLLHRVEAVLPDMRPELRPGLILLARSATNGE